MKKLLITLFVSLLMLTGCAGLPEIIPAEQEQADSTPAKTAVPLPAEIVQPTRAAPTDTDIPETFTETPTVPPSSPTPTQPPSDTATAFPTPVVPGSDSDREEIVAVVAADLAQQLGISPDQITVIRVTAKTWSDASLGCPEPGMMYAQVLTPGYQMILDAGGNQYVYRTDQSGNFKLCQ